MAIIQTSSSLDRIPEGAVNIKDISDRWRHALGKTPYLNETQEEFNAKKAVDHSGLHFIS